MNICKEFGESATLSL